MGDFKEGLGSRKFYRNHLINFTMHTNQLYLLDIVRLTHLIPLHAEILIFLCYILIRNKNVLGYYSSDNLVSLLEGFKRGVVLKFVISILVRELPLFPRVKVMLTFFHLRFWSRW